MHAGGFLWRSGDVELTTGMKRSQVCTSSPILAKLSRLTRKEETSGSGLDVGYSYAAALREEEVCTVNWVEVF